ncbi:5,6-dimethylbenzimidazole synthase [Pseudobacteriovorax antillogorgiicola]|uniref:Cob(II)yrinic acid a,c-diamide reductase n=1 Tax=Pseudobacteriovorax antillogorgiicola TaxID=1513793 RepID=A0A1Y6CW69_9BACT|nr:5,6-dimethylbenzimidazole synthase [Pseudobacteriovorax antillogorgiicola]TCS41896.1 cob(II)yrinic acid a,c-diamide reductase [Pseudobacteriovorax antillogorgiicola]SMF83161.1 cob(II)yrinic acid a,c-diamide reductase [Pseudobacteriovorax antillogorgiicola]
MGPKFSIEDQELLKQIMVHRRDIRGNRFTPEQISDDDLQQVIDAAFLAPSVGYSQPWKIVVIQSPATRAVILENFDRANASAENQFHGQRKQVYSKLKLEGIKECSHLLAVYYREPIGPVLGQTTMKEAGPYSVVCAIQNMWLMARAKNIGLGWVSILDSQDLNEQLQVPAGFKLVALLCLGYVDQFPEEPELKTLGWEQERPLSEMISFETFS